MTEPHIAGFERELDRALSRVLQPPAIPQGFRERLQATVSRSGESDLRSLRERLEGERRRQLEELEADYVRVRRGTLGTLIGAAFVAGAAATIAMPWLRAHLGDHTPFAVAWGAVALGLGMTFLEPLRRLLQREADID